MKKLISSISCTTIGRLKQKRSKDSWGYRETAKKLNCSLGGLSTDLAFAEGVEDFS